MPEFKDPQAEKHYYETEASQEEFLTWYQKQEFPNYPKPALTVDNVILRWYQADPEEAPQLQLLLIKRKAHPFLGHYALPGGFVEPDEDTTQATIREVLLPWTRYELSSWRPLPVQVAIHAPGWSRWPISSTCPMIAARRRWQGMMLAPFAGLISR